MQPQADPFIVPKCEADIEIVYQDDYLLVIDKPTKLLSLSGKHPENKDSVHLRITKSHPTATLIHRLDFGTSGLMLLALNKDINKLLCKQFSDRTVIKHYEAILNGKLESELGIIELPLIKDIDGFPLQKVCFITGKRAVSQFELQTYNSETNTSKVLFKPITGRTHQLRLHSQAIGHPIIGCDLYDAEDSFHKAKRLMLHASYLEFTHPVTQARLSFNRSSDSVLKHQ